MATMISDKKNEKNSIGFAHNFFVINVACSQSKQDKSAYKQAIFSVFSVFL